MYDFFKQGFCKKLIPAALHRYERQKPIEEDIKDVDIKFVPKKEIIDKLLRPALEVGCFMKYNSQGFVSNKCQFLMGGLAAFEVGKLIREKIPQWKAGGLSLEEANKLVNVIKWREIMNIIVKWRKVSEPNDPVFWVDGLTKAQFKEGFGANTPMFIGETRTVRYYSQYERGLNMVKDLLPKQFRLKKGWAPKIRQAKDIEEILKIVGCDFHVQTDCYSENFKNTKYEGTHLLGQRNDKGYEFAIKTTCREDRWKEYDKELDACWKKIVILVLTRKGEKGEDKDILTAILGMMFYWYNFMPLSRGTAACGFVLLFALLATLGKKLNVHVPKDMQIDWEAILCSDPKKFESLMLEWIGDGIVDLDIDNIPKVSEVLPNLRDVIQAFNYCPKVNFKE